MKRCLIRIGALLLALVAVTMLQGASRTFASALGPQRLVYNGHLLNSGGNPIMSPHTIRFSLWTSADHVPGDVTSSGAINIFASTYANWKEAFTVTPGAKGYFSVQLGSGTALPNFASYTQAQLQSLHLQVEVKGADLPMTEYEFLDTDGADPAIDRAPLLAVPFALNADMLDQRDVGTGSGNIALLGPGGTFTPARIPGGTNSGTLVIDHDGSESTTVSLQFGKTIGKVLSYDGSNGRFNFNDDVRVQGDLTVTGLINGVNIASLANDSDVHLKASSGAGLTISVANGSYRLNGNVTNFAGTSTLSMTNQATNYVFFGSGGLKVSTIGFPTDESIIRVAQVTATGGSVTAITDRRVFNSDDREHTVAKDYHAAFEHTTPQGDATNNIGRLSIDYDNTNLRNFYKWTSTSTSLQDYDVIVRVTLSTEFVRWGSGSLMVRYRSTSASAGNNKMDISVFDTNGSPVTLIGGSSTDLANTSWTATTLNFGGSPTWTPGQDFLIKFKVYAKDNYQMHLGDLRLTYVDLENE